MTKVYPNAILPAAPTSVRDRTSSSSSELNTPVVLTVWKKSLLFNCDGFTVFDAKGNLVFRVDNYNHGGKGEIVLMDSSGSSLLTIRRKRVILTDNWLVFAGETAENPLFSVTKRLNLLNTKSLAHVSSTCTGSPKDKMKKKKKKNEMMYEIEGSYGQRCCAVYDDKKRRVSEIKRKEAVGGAAFGVDVFRLIVQPEINQTVAMALVVLLDQMYGSSGRFTL